MPLRKVSRCHQDFVKIVYTVADKLQLSDIEYTTEIGSEDIDSFLDGTYKVQIKGCKDGHKVKYYVIIKWHSDPNIRIRYRELLKREFVFYENIVPVLLETQRRFKVIEGLKMKFPNCIFASAECDKETIVVLSLREHGFSMLDRFHEIDLVHASLVMKHLAKLHALSFVVEKRDPREFVEMKSLYSKDVQYSNPDRISYCMENYFHASVNVVSNSNAKKKLKELAPYFLQVLSKCTKSVPHSVICHADCWNNNILFKYQGKRPVDVLFVDYQFSRYASPVTDLSYFFYMSTGQDILFKYYNHLLDIYYGTFTAVLRYCNLDVEEVYPKNIFEKHLKEYSVFGLIEALVSMKIITAAAEEAFQMTESKYGSSEKSFYEDVSQNHSLYVDRVNIVVNAFFSQGYSLNAVLDT